MQLKQQELQLKAQAQQATQQFNNTKLASSEKMHTEKLALEKEKVTGDLQLGAAELGVDIQHKKHNLAAQSQQAGLNAGLEIAKHKREALQQDRAQNEAERSARQQEALAARQKPKKEDK